MTGMASTIFMIVVETPKIHHDHEARWLAG
jgi:hypothetical protein